jgi:hypothetical protein
MMKKLILTCLTLVSLLLGASVAISGQTAPARAETTTATYGADANPTGNPIGGGAGYSNIITSGDYTVTTKAELLAALASASSGQTVYIPGTASIDIGASYNIVVPDGVTLASNRGYNGSSGGLVYGSAVWTHFQPIFWAHSHTTFNGIRLQGVSSGTSNSDYRAGIANNLNHTAGNYHAIIVENCEIWGFAYAGVSIWDDGATGLDDVHRRSYIHHNNIHHCQQSGFGYGIDNGWSSTIIEANIFDYGRHFIAGNRTASGEAPTNYEARYNIFGANCTSHMVDCHGGNDINYPTGDKTIAAGGTILVHHNTFKNTNFAHDVAIRGVPTVKAEFYHNWNYKSLSTYSTKTIYLQALTMYGLGDPATSYMKMSVHDNWYGTTPPPGVSAYSATTTSSTSFQTSSVISNSVTTSPVAPSETTTSSTSFQTSSVISNSVPASPVAPSGMTAGLTSTEYKYSAMTTDPDADALIYLFFWGDGTFSATAPVDSGVTAATTHAWSQPGTYAVFVKAADANGAVSVPSYALSVKVLSPLQAAATQESSRAVGTPSDGSSTGPSDAVDGDASGNPSHGSLDNQSSPLVPAHGSGFVWWLFSVSVIMGAAVLLIGAIVRDTISEPPGW